MSDSIGYGVIGTGMVGGEHILDLNHIEGAQVVALADPDVDVVVITSPNFTHAAVLADALATDKHVLIEKPLCTTVDDCKRVVDTAANRDALTWMGQQYRYVPTPAAMLELLDTGVVGTTRMVSIREHRNRS